MNTSTLPSVNITKWAIRKFGRWGQTCKTPTVWSVAGSDGSVYRAGAERQKDGSAARLAGRLHPPRTRSRPGSARRGGGPDHSVGGVDAWPISADPGNG